MYGSRYKFFAHAFNTLCTKTSSVGTLTEIFFPDSGRRRTEERIFTLDTKTAARRSLNQLHRAVISDACFWDMLELKFGTSFRYFWNMMSGLRVLDSRTASSYMSWKVVIKWGIIIKHNWLVYSRFASTSTLMSILLCVQKIKSPGFTRSSTDSPPCEDS